MARSQAATRKAAIGALHAFFAAVDERSEFDDIVDSLKVRADGDSTSQIGSEMEEIQLIRSA